MGLVEKKYKLPYFVANPNLMQDNEKGRIVICRKTDPMVINCASNKFAALERCQADHGDTKENEDS